MVQFCSGGTQHGIEVFALEPFHFLKKRKKTVYSSFLWIEQKSQNWHYSDSSAVKVSIGKSTQNTQTWVAKISSLGMTWRLWKFETGKVGTLLTQVCFTWVKSLSLGCLLTFLGSPHHSCPAYSMECSNRAPTHRHPGLSPVFPVTGYYKVGCLDLSPLQLQRGDLSTRNVPPLWL